MLEREALTPAAFLITHGHSDHAGGNDVVLARGGVHAPAHLAIAGGLHPVEHQPGRGAGPCRGGWGGPSSPGHPRAR
ncbi:MAG: MBL fold metallo-hydrolase [Cellulomonadaceae bacterium]|nr:MBL fold metallo-hydrolase [Cellulomonadaceae bacterium]